MSEHGLSSRPCSQSGRSSPTECADGPAGAQPEAGTVGTSRPSRNCTRVLMDSVATAAAAAVAVVVITDDDDVH